MNISTFTRSLFHYNDFDAHSKSPESHQTRVSLMAYCALHRTTAALTAPKKSPKHSFPHMVSEYRYLVMRGSSRLASRTSAGLWLSSLCIASSQNKVQRRPSDMPRTWRNEVTHSFSRTEAQRQPTRRPSFYAIALLFSTLRHGSTSAQIGYARLLTN
jgi:hypothetical protein